jgi:coenzyme Q-binding protein COQ10
MPQFSTTRRVSHSASDMFDLVADVERYPEFVPLCQSLSVRRRSTDSEGREVVVADMTVAYKFIRETFTSRVTLDREKLTILVEYLEGPFRRMNNRWTFRPETEHSCEVEFFLAYEFRSRALALLMGNIFDAAFRRFATAFERRANQVYGAHPA